MANENEAFMLSEIPAQRDPNRQKWGNFLQFFLYRVFYWQFRLLGWQLEDSKLAEFKRNIWLVEWHILMFWNSDSWQANMIFPFFFGIFWKKELSFFIMLVSSETLSEVIRKYISKDSMHFKGF